MNKFQWDGVVGGSRCCVGGGSCRVLFVCVMEVMSAVKMVMVVYGDACGGGDDSGDVSTRGDEEYENKENNKQSYLWR